MPNVTFAQAAGTLGITGLQLNALMRNPACPPPTVITGPGVAGIQFDQAQVAALAVTLGSVRANGWEISTGTQLAAANLTQMAAAPAAPNYRPALSDVLFDDYP